MGQGSTNPNGPWRHSSGRILVRLGPSYSQHERRISLPSLRDRCGATIAAQATATRDRVKSKRCRPRNKTCFNSLIRSVARALRIQIGRVLEMAASSSNKYAYENKTAEKFGGAKGIGISGADALRPNPNRRRPPAGRGLVYRRSGWPCASRGSGKSIRDLGSEQPALGQLEQDLTLGTSPGLLCACETFLGILPVFFRCSHYYITLDGFGNYKTSEASIPLPYLSLSKMRKAPVFRRAFVLAPLAPKGTIPDLNRDHSLSASNGAALFIALLIRRLPRSTCIPGSPSAWAATR